VCAAARKNAPGRAFSGAAAAQPAHMKLDPEHMKLDPAWKKADF